jgi:hypothetical protein
MLLATKKDQPVEVKVNIKKWDFSAHTYKVEMT